MFDQHTIDKICNDERLQVPFYSNLNQFLTIEEEPLSDFYQMTAPEKVAMDLSDTEYATIAYHMDICFLDWLITNALQAL